MTFPQLRPIIIGIGLLDVLWTTQQFTLVWIATGGGPLGSTQVLGSYIYTQAFQSYLFSPAAAGAMLLLLGSLYCRRFVRPPSEALGADMTAITTRATKRRIWSKVGLYVALLAGAIFAGGPVLWMLSSSFKSNADIFVYRPRLISKSFSAMAYAAVFNDPQEIRFFINSYVVASP